MELPDYLWNDLVIYRITWLSLELPSPLWNDLAFCWWIWNIVDLHRWVFELLISKLLEHSISPFAAEWLAIRNRAQASCSVDGTHRKDDQQGRKVPTVDAVPHGCKYFWSSVPWPDQRYLIIETLLINSTHLGHFISRLTGLWLIILCNASVVSGKFISAKSSSAP